MQTKTIITISKRKNRVMCASLDKNKVILGLSGGVDSTTAALLLKEQGFQVIGLYLDVKEENQQGIEAARTVAQQVGIDFLHKNVSNAFQNIVIDNFCHEYLSGRTPSPCVLCNPTIKFKTLIDEANRFGAYYIATGHYARTGYNERLQCWCIRQAKNEKKDQSYMLHRLSESVISRLMLPLEHLTEKEEVRAIARSYHLSNAEQKDSQELCFIDAKQNYIDYMKQQGCTSRPGNFINKENQVLGQHQGLMHYTIGQRKGLGITFGKPVFVTKMNAATNTVTLGEHEDLFSSKVISKNNFFQATGNGTLPESLENQEITAKIRYAAKPAKGTIKSRADGFVEVEFTEKQRAATPGQAIVFYLDGFVIGGGYIEERQ